jgi:hypothetical protein
MLCYEDSGLFLKVNNTLDFFEHNNIAVKVSVHVGNLFTPTPIKRTVLWAMDTSVGTDRLSEIAEDGSKLLGCGHVVRGRGSCHVGILVYWYIK